MYNNKVFKIIKAVFTLPSAIKRFYAAKRKADFWYRCFPTRYYVLANSPTHLIVTSKEYQKGIRKKPIHTNQRTRKTRLASGEDMQRDCYYFTPTKYGKTPKQYKRILRAKLWKYIKHHFYLSTK